MSDHPDPPPHSRRPVPFPLARHRDLLAAIASGFVGALALATSTYNVYLQRQQVRAQVWPHVLVRTDFSNALFTITLINRGVGPAEVGRVRVTVDGKRADDWFGAEKMILRRPDFDVWSAGVEPVEGQVLSPGEELLTLKVGNARDAREMFANMDRLSTEVCYCSTLGECWIYSEKSALDPSTTTSVASCPPDPVPFRAATHDTLKELQASVLDARPPMKDGGVAANERKVEDAGPEAR